MFIKRQQKIDILIFINEQKISMLFRINYFVQYRIKTETYYIYIYLSFKNITNTTK